MSLATGHAAPSSIPSLSWSDGGEACQPWAGPGVEGDANRAREHPGAERSDDVDVGSGKPLPECLELAEEDCASARVGAALAARALDLPPGALRIDLQTDEELMVLRSGGRGADEVEVRLHRQRVERDRASVPRVAEVAADLVAVGRDGSLDPLHAGHGASLAGEAREDIAPAGLAGFLLCSIEETEGGHPHREHRGVRAGAPVLHHADRLPA